MKKTLLPRFAALAASISAVAAVPQGFNYGSTFTDGSAKQLQDFVNEFTTAQNLVGAPGNGFTSARLYTMVQAGTSNSPISAIPAAISTKTHLLLGMWASAGDAAFANELAALQNTISQYGSQLSGLIDGISIGSEDLYRISPTGIENKENPGAGPDVLVGYIKQVRAALAITPLSTVPLGHVDTWTAWVNASNVAVANACDWVGVDAYPYFQNTMANSIENSKSLFDAAYSATQAAVNGRPVWVTETGFPVSGKTSNLAVPGLAAAKTYWDQVGCPLFSAVPTYWYTLQDSAPTTPDPSFGIVGNPLSTTPLFDISCKKVAVSSSSSSSTSSATSDLASESLPTGSGSASDSSAAPATTTGSPVLGGGSPGGVPSSQQSLEHSSAGLATASSSTKPTSGSGSGSGAGNSSTPTGTSTASAKPSTVTGAAEVLRGSLAGALVVGAFAVVAL